MKILFVLDQFPFPPRNGVTVPIANMIVGLGRKHQIDILLLTESADTKPENCTRRETAEQIIHHTWRVQRHRVGLPARVWSEVSGKSMVSHGWLYPEDDIDSLLENMVFDVVVVSPFSVVDSRRFFPERLREQVIWIAVIHDSKSLSMWKSATRSVRISSGLWAYMRALAAFIRLPRVRSTEMRWLGEYDRITVQSNKEVEWIERYAGEELVSRVKILSNGVDDELFHRNYTGQENGVLFFAELGGEYAQTAKWVLNEIWPRIEKLAPQSRLLVVGRSAPAWFLEELERHKGAEYRGFVPELKDVFDGCAVMLAPIFKGFGLINKVVQAMAAGVPVVGDSTAFNGIDGFQENVHGMVAERASGFAKEAADLLLDKERGARIAGLARELIQDRFRWEDRVISMENLIAEAVESKAKVSLR